MQVSHSPTKAVRSTVPSAKVAKGKLDVALIEGFQRHYLLAGFDDPAKTAEFHRTMWSDSCDEANKYCAWAAPRHHSKSTSITFTFAMAVIVFRMRDHILIISDSEGQAVAQLKEIKNEFYENEELCADFGFRQFLKDTDTEIILEFADGYLVRILARGSEQRLRGMKWRGKRPNLVLGDDLEFDEIVSNPERLKKFKDWFYKQLLPIGSKDCLFRLVGTILAFNSLLMDLMNDPGWKSRLWSAHEAFDDFTNILWPEKWPEADLRALRQLFINAGKSDGYSQEMLNRPIAEGNSFFEREDMLDIPFAQYRDWETDPGKRPVIFYASVDLAVSTRQSADRSVINIATVDADRYLDVIDVRLGRWDPKELVDQIFEAHDSYEPDTWFIESGTILKAIGPYLEEEMARRNCFLTLHLMVPSKDKVTRAKSIQARHKARRVRYDKSADWYPGVEQEMLQFPRGAHDDFVDTMSQFGLALDEIITPPTEDEVEEENYYAEAAADNRQGRNAVTGY
jgi:predicted phage terminase large subunit-like protein